MSVKIQEEDLGLCPSFNSYCTNGIADAASRAGREISGESSSVSDSRRFSWMNSGEEDDEENDFEFVSPHIDSGVFCDAKMAPVFPIFNYKYNLLVEDIPVRGVGDSGRDRVGDSAIRIPFEKLTIRVRDDDRLRPSPSVHELEGIPSGTYCFWKPKSVESLNATCKKSSSTGSSLTKRWKIREFLRRSHSDEKNSYVSLTPNSTSNSTKKKTERKTEKPGNDSNAEKKIHSSETNYAVGSKSTTAGGGGERKAFTAHETFYIMNRALKEEGKRKSYLPYKPELVGCWTSVGIGKTSFHQRPNLAN